MPKPEPRSRRFRMRRGRGGLRWVLAAALTLGMLLAPRAAAACAGAYAAALRQVEAQLRGGTSAQTAAEELRAIALADGAAPALDPIIVALQSGDVATGEGMLQSLASTLEPRSGEGCATPYGPAAGEKLAGVYRSPAFAGLDHPPPPNWAQRIVNAIASFLQGLSSHLGEPLSLALGIALLSALAGIAAWRLGKVIGLRRQPQAAPGAVEPSPADADGEWTRAVQAAAAGDFREAVRRAFRSALLTLSGRGRLAVDPAWTSAELLARAGADAELVGPLSAAAGQFDVAWYSGGRVSDADWEAMRAHCRAVRALGGDRSVAV